MNITNNNYDKIRCFIYFDHPLYISIKDQKKVNIEFIFCLEKCHKIHQNTYEKNSTLNILVIVVYNIKYKALI